MTTTPQLGLTLRDLRASCDAEAITDPARWGSGYHETQKPWAYDPAFEQSRDAWFELLEQIVERELNGTFLQIGLGRRGGTQRVFERLAQRAVCVEIDAARVNAYHGRSEIVHGDSTDPAIVEQVRERVGRCDLLWIDGDACFESVRADWSSYASLVRPGGLIVIVDASQDQSFDGRSCDVDDLVRELDNSVLAPNGVTLSRAGCDRAIHYYEQPDFELDGEVRLPAMFVPTPTFARTLEHDGFAVWTDGVTTFAIDAAFEHFDARALRRGEYGSALVVADAATATASIDAYRSGERSLGLAGDLLLRGDPAGARTAVHGIQQDLPALEPLLRDSLGAFAYSTEIGLSLGTLLLLSGREREGLAWLEALLDRDISNGSLLRLVAAAHLELLEDQVGARQVIERLQRRVASARVYGVCSRMMDESPGLWRYPQLVEGLQGVIQVGAHRGEEVDAFTRVGLSNQLYFEPHPNAFADLVRACHRDDGLERIAHPFAISRRSGSVMLHVGEDSASSSMFEPRVGRGPSTRVPVESRTLDELVEQGVIDPSRYDLLVVDAEGAELEVLEGARRLLASIQVVCVAVHYAPEYVDASTPDRVRAFLAECDEFGFNLRAHDPERDTRRGNAIYTRSARRRRKL